MIANCSAALRKPLPFLLCIPEWCFFSFRVHASKHNIETGCVDGHKKTTGRTTAAPAIHPTATTPAPLPKTTTTTTTTNLFAVRVGEKRRPLCLLGPLGLVAPHLLHHQARPHLSHLPGFNGLSEFAVDLTVANQQNAKARNKIRYRYITRKKYEVCQMVGKQNKKTSEEAVETPVPNEQEEERGEEALLDVCVACHLQSNVFMILL